MLWYILYILFSRKLGSWFSQSAEWEYSQVKQNTRLTSACLARAEHVNQTANTAALNQPGLQHPTTPLPQITTHHPLTDCKLMLLTRGGRHVGVFFWKNKIKRVVLTRASSGHVMLHHCERVIYRRPQMMECTHTTMKVRELFRGVVSNHVMS